MKIHVTIPILTATLILGCTLPMVKTSWSKTGAQPGEFKRDSVICDEDQGRTGLGLAAAFDVYMQQKGWFLIEEPVN